VPAEIVAKLNREIGAIALLPEVQKKLAADGVEPAVPNTPAECRTMFEREFARLEKFFRTSGIKP
jgi:tripartite-type tricarboxylate transporter receptor subunit TctC